MDLDGFFGLHPELAPLLGAWDSGNLAIVHACGAPDESRSHFKAMDLVERGVDNESGPASGWLGRHLGTCDTGNHSPLRALAFGERAPRSLLGPAPVLALRSVEDIGMCDDVRATELMRRSLASMYVSDDGLGRIGRETLEMLDVLDRLDPRGYQPRGGATYPETDFGRGLREIALLTKADVGLEVATLDLGGWDTHFAQGVVTGQMPRLMRELAQALSAFHTDMSSHLGKVSVVVMTEFGRRAYENASLGTDHGHGGLMLLMGGNVAGGRVHGDWPGLDGRLVGPGDLAITTDYRDVLAEVLSKRRHCDAYGEIFPDYTPTMRGVVTS